MKHFSLKCLIIGFFIVCFYKKLATLHLPNSLKRLFLKTALQTLCPTPNLIISVSELSMYLFLMLLIIFIGPVSLFFVMRVIGDPFSKMQIYGIINLILDFGMAFQLRHECLWMINEFIGVALGFV